MDSLATVAFARALVDIDSTTGREHAAGAWLADTLSGLGYTVRTLPVERGCFNVLATLDEPSVVFSTHFDCVPPFIPSRVADGRLYGRGACDAKGILAAQVAAAERLRGKGETRIGLVFVGGEERGSDGAKAANRIASKSRFLINGEPTESRLASGAKGSLRVTVKTRGREAHSAYPHLGRSAIEPMLELLPTIRSLDLPTDPVLGETTVNIGTIRGGTEANIIPGECEAELMFRLVGDVARVKAMIEQWAGDRAEIDYGSYIPAQHFHVVSGFDVAPVAYTSDIPLLGRWGTPLMFGPGSIHVAHTPNEYIDVRELRESVTTYERLVRSLLTSA